MLGGRGRAHTAAYTDFLFVTFGLPGFVLSGWCRYHVSKHFDQDGDMGEEDVGGDGWAVEVDDGVWEQEQGGWEREDG